MSFTRVDFPDPDTPGHRHQASQREGHVDGVQVVLARPAHHQLVAGPRTALVGNGDGSLPGQVLPRHRRRRGEEAGHVAAVDDLTSVLPGAGPDVDDVIGGADGLLVVLDDDHGVPEVAQAHQGVEQTPVVALVQSDRRFVEDVQHPHEPRTDLARQTDALRFASRQGGGAPGQGEVVEPHVEQETAVGPAPLAGRGRR